MLPGKSSKSLSLSAFVVLTSIAMLLAGCRALPDVAKLDLHVAVTIEADGSNQVDFQAATNPLLDKPLADALLSWCVASGGTASNSAAGASAATTSAKGFECRESKRDGRQYHTVTARFASLGDLNSFMNTPYQITGLLSIFAPDARSPRLFEEFEATQVTDGAQPGFRVHALLSDDLAPLLNFCRITVHTKLPYEVEAKGTAGQVRGGEVSWTARPGAGQAIEVASVEPIRMSVGRRIDEFKSAKPVLFWLPVGLVGLALIGGLTVVVGRQLARRREVDPWNMPAG